MKMTKLVVLAWIALGLVGQAAENPAPARPTVFNSKVWYDGARDAALPAALASGTVRYRVVSDPGTESVDLGFDFEAALHAWLDSLGFGDVAVLATPTNDDADVIVHFGPKAWIDLPSGMEGHSAHHYRDPYDLRRDKIISVIELQSVLADEAGHALPWTSIPAARAEKATARVLENGRARVRLVTDVFGGEHDDPATVARRLVAGKPWLDRSELVTGAGGAGARLSFWTFLHELGHAFGLTDLYAYPGNEYADPTFPSVMRDMSWRPLVPTADDIENVSAHIRDSGLCERLLR